MYQHAETGVEQWRPTPNGYSSRSGRWLHTSMFCSLHWRHAQDIAAGK
jgi:hypothetical protein